MFPGGPWAPGWIGHQRLSVSRSPSPLPATPKPVRLDLLSPSPSAPSPACSRSSEAQDHQVPPASPPSLLVQLSPQAQEGSSKEMRPKLASTLECFVLPFKPPGMGEAAPFWGAAWSPQVAQSQINTGPELSPAEGPGAAQPAPCRLLGREPVAAGPGRGRGGEGGRREQGGSTTKAQNSDSPRDRALLVQLRLPA